jgi:DNA-binding protein HU-beta
MKKNAKTQKSMNKKSIVASISELSDLSKDESTKALDATMLSITKSLKDGNEVRIPGFGSFKVVQRPALNGRNPRTGETLKIHAKKIPKFRPSLMLKDAIS